MHRLGDGRFELLREVGEGAFGVVYEARDRKSEQRVAVKMMQEIGRVAEGRFEREALLLADLSHPAIVRYVAHGRADNGHNYLVMEWLEGETLDARMHRALLSVGDVLTLAQRVVAGLAAAELRGIVHRDIKPANLFLVDNDVGATKILDLGLARRIHDQQRLTRTGGIVGTAVYMSPEQARGEPNIDPRSDVFSLGAVLYECLCNDLPFEGTHAIATLAKICMEEPLPVQVNARHVPKRLAELVHAMLAKPRERRPTYRTLARELAALDREDLGERAHVPTRARPQGSSATTELHSSQRELSSRAGEQRVISALFVRGAGEWNDVLEHELDKVAQRHGARRERLLEGSQILLLEGLNSASDQAIISAQCALTLSKLIERSAPITICTGRVRLAAAQPVLGELLERGLRQLWLTPKGTIRLDDASAALLETRFEIRTDAGTHTLERLRSGGESPRTLLGRPTRFVGRERELTVLTSLFQECAGEPVARPALVTAPPGGGKSRLQYELVERLKQAGDAFTVLVARADATRTRTQYGTLAAGVWSWAGIVADDALAVRRTKLREALQRAVPAQRVDTLSYYLGEMIRVPYGGALTPAMQAASADPPLMAERMLDAFLEWLRALSDDAPLLLCVEDLHWSDPASVRFLDTALRMLHDRPLMVVAFARPEVRDVHPDLWSDRDLIELRLPKLTARNCEKLLDAMVAGDAGFALDANLRGWLIERADGNPFFLEELVRSLRDGKSTDDLPDSVLGIVQARIDALGDELKRVVRTASVFGQQFTVAALRELLAGSGDGDLARQLSALTEREVIFPRSHEEGEYSFRHALIRDAAYVLLEDEQRVRTHRLAARWLEQQGASAAVLAEHFERAGEGVLAAGHWRTAAVTAFDAGTVTDVIRCGERAIAAGAPPDIYGEVAALIAEACGYEGNQVEAIRWSEAARDRLAPGMPAWWRAAQAGAIAYAQLDAAKLPELIAQMTALPPEAPPAMARLTSIVTTAMELERTHWGELSSQLLALLPPRMTFQEHGRTYVHYLLAQAIRAAYRGDRMRSLALVREACECDKIGGQGRDVASSTLHLGCLLLYEFGDEECELPLRECIEHSDRSLFTGMTAYAQMCLAQLRLNQGEVDEAQELLRDAIGTFERLQGDSYACEALSALACAQLRVGDVAGARDTLARVREGVLEPLSRATLLDAQVRLLLASGETTRALERAREGIALLRTNTARECSARLMCAHIDSLRACGHHDEAAAAIADAKAWIERESARIDHPKYRHSFRTKLPENVRILAY